MAGQQSSNEHTSATPGRRLVLFSLLFLLLSAAGTWTIYSQFAERNFSFDDRLLHPGFLAGAVVLLLIYFLSDGLRLYYTLRALGHRVPFRDMFRLVFINIFFSNVTPMATGGGVAQIWYLRRHGVRLGTATAATTLRTVLAVAFIFTVTPACLIWMDALQGRAIIGRIAELLAVFIVLYLGFFAVVLWRTHWLIMLLTGLLQAVRRARLIGPARHKRWQFRMKREMTRFSRAFTVYRRGPRRYIALSILFTLLFLVSLFSFPALLMQALGYDVDYLMVLGLLFVTTFVMYFAPTPGASGISEGVFGTFFSPILGPGHLVLVTVAWRFLTIYLGMIVGLVMTQVELSGDRRQKREALTRQVARTGDDPT
ncbi:lysylphosphatidylglycerol synthase transmembrane domain-containing protein [Marinobacter bohaiensis]|uniref:lysylphosphatidylglycerol synthase transmembrane domain-containing protein n=1 Tax=Marinobacter bohaiensis TaxID=2201898 RepID=UPI000DAB4685|nr:lysylphosphatidylglycerol synthase transmembrane domain-containing protein [Marinobacter bohaiensis]